LKDYIKIFFGIIVVVVILLLIIKGLLYIDNYKNVSIAEKSIYNNKKLTVGDVKTYKKNRKHFDDLFGKKRMCENLRYFHDEECDKLLELEKMEVEWESYKKESINLN